MSLSLRKALCALQLESSTRSSHHRSDTFAPRLTYHRYPKMQYDDDLEIIEPPIRTRPKTDAQVILLSDDEEDVENRPPIARGRRNRPRSADSSSRASSLLVEADHIHQPRHHVAKRLKTESGNVVIPERVRRAPLIGYDDGYTKANVSFSPNGSRANLLFKTGDYFHPPPAKTLLPDRTGFVQDLGRDPFTSAPIPMFGDQCPFYYDTRYDVKMYKGPGYERFPVVLGTVKGHKILCDKWEADKNEQHEEDQLYISGLSGGVNPFSITKTQTAARLERQCVLEVQAIFPQIQPKFVLEKYRARRAATDTQDSDILPSTIDIISEIAELTTYPKEEAPEMPDELVLPEDGLGVTIVYNKDIPKDDTYVREALRMLADEFKHIPTIIINRVLQEKQSLFDTFTYFNQAEATYFDLPRDEKPYTRSKQPRVHLEKKYSRGVFEPKNSRLYVNLVNEFQAAKQHDARELYRLKKDQDKEAAEAENLHIHKLEGSLVECQTCFDEEIPMNRALMCEGGRWPLFLLWMCRKACRVTNWRHEA